jgi:hypothetical protein
MRLTRHHRDRDTRGAHELRRETPDVRHRFGGLDLPAAFAGTLAGLGAAGLIAAIGASWFNAQDVSFDRDQVLSTSGLVAGLVLVVLPALIGGWVTGRCSRYEGSGNGLVTGLLLILLSVGLGALAASQSQAGTSFALPSWVTDEASSTTSLVGALIGAGIVLLAAALGGLLGSSWHRRVDRALVRQTEDSAFEPYPDFDRHPAERVDTDAETRTS